ncbi:MAG TPA: hypothetical protein DEQ38_07980 [Elusimicrobia bacterium]|nr:MAG: hypothetical protein A2089_06160 [Elusimicrobia bacterium GWD2_63_28]HCC48034.1 hypothetical protein [Elusimicrobiota bacterium]
MTTAEKPRLYLLLAALAACAALAAHLPFLSGGLLWDDEQFLAKNSFVTDCANLGTALNPVNLVKVLPVPMSARPAVSASLIADACAGLGPRGMKATNALVHACSAALLFFLLFLLTGSAAGALFGALAFALHPAAAEAVHVITFRSHLLGFFFFCAGLLSALFYARRPSLLTGAAAAASYLLAVLSVETPVIMPAAALLAVFYDSGRAGVKRAAPLFLALVLAGGFYLWFRAPRAGYTLPRTAPGIAAPSALYPAALLPPPELPRQAWALLPPWREIYTNPAARLYTMSGIALGYLRELALPYGLAADYNPEVIKTFSRGALPLAACLAALAGSALLFYRRRTAGLALLLIFTALLPALNLWPLYNIKADRYLYLPLAGFALLCAALFRGILPPRRGALPAAAACLWLLWLGAETLRRGPEFRDNLSLFSAAAARSPSSPRAQANLAAARLRAGDCAGALGPSRQALALDPDAQTLRLRLAYTLAWCGSAAEVPALLRSYPPDADSLFLSGLVLLKKDRPRAAALLRSALEASPGRREFYLALLLAEKKKPADPRDREDLARLKAALAAAGLLF